MSIAAIICFLYVF